MKLSPFLVMHKFTRESLNDWQSSWPARILTTICTTLLQSEEELIMVLASKGIHVNESVYPELYHRLERICTTINMPVPDLFIKHQDNLASSFVYHQAYIVVSPDLLVNYTEEFQDSVLTKECSKILCFICGSNYSALQYLANLVLNGDTLTIRLLRRFCYGRAARLNRALDFTTDRVIMMIADKPEIIARFCMALAGTYDASIPPEEVEAYIRDAYRFQKLFGNGYIRLRVTRKMEHLGYEDMMVASYKDRVYEAMEWSKTEEYKKLKRYVECPDSLRECPVHFTNDEMVGKDAALYDVFLHECGFTNITEVFMWKRELKTSDGGIISVSINGLKDYKPGQFFPTDVPIVIDVQKRPEHLPLH